MTRCHHYQITLKVRRIPGCLSVMADFLSYSNQKPVNRMVTASASVQTYLSKVLHPSCRPVCHSSEPQRSFVRISSPRSKCLGHRCSEYKLVGSPCLCLPCHISRLQGDPKNQAMHAPHHCNCRRLAKDTLALGSSAALHGAPTPVTCVNDTPETVPHAGLSQQPSVSQPSRLVFRSGQLQEQGF